MYFGLFWDGIYLKIVNMVSSIEDIVISYEKFNEVIERHRSVDSQLGQILRLVGINFKAIVLAASWRFSVFSQRELGPSHTGSGRQYLIHWQTPEFLSDAMLGDVFSVNTYPTTDNRAG